MVHDLLFEDTDLADDIIGLWNKYVFPKDAISRFLIDRPQSRLRDC
jgi:hypothetical protein